MFHTYRQNNSGGSFDVDIEKGIGHFVVIEYPDNSSANVANAIAQSKGLYFDGFGDCSCCGNRWSEMWSDETGNKVPSIYGEAFTGFIEKPSDDYSFNYWEKKLVVVHYLNGDVKYIEYSL